METKEKRINQLVTLCEKYQPLPNVFEDVVFMKAIYLARCYCDSYTYPLVTRDRFNTVFLKPFNDLKMKYYVFGVKFGSKLNYEQIQYILKYVKRVSLPSFGFYLHPAKKIEDDLFQIIVRALRDFFDSKFSDTQKLVEKLNKVRCVMNPSC